MNAKLHADEFRYIVEHAEASLIIATPDLAESVAFHPRLLVLETPEWRRMYAADTMAVTPSRPEDPAWLFYTSGRPGAPRARC